MADVPTAPEALSLPPQELRVREAILRDGGPLASAMRAVEAYPWRTPGWLTECWLWVMFLTIARGFRGATTGADYVEAVARFMRWVEEQRLDYATLTKANFDGWMRWLFITRKLSVPSRRQALMAVKSLYAWRSRDNAALNCAAGIAAPKRVTTTAKKYSPKQLRALFQAVKEAPSETAAVRNKAILLVLFATGARREEVTALRVDQLEITGPKAGTLHIFGKGAKERMVPIQGPVVSALIAWLDARSRIEGLCTDALFVSLSRRVSGAALTPKSIENLVKATAKRAGLGNWGVHRFRVTFATMMYDDGLDIERIRVLMGHESIETTRRYLAVSNRMNRHSLKAHRQHAALGTVPDDMPLWAQDIERRRDGSGILPQR